MASAVLRNVDLDDKTNETAHHSSDQITFPSLPHLPVRSTNSGIGALPSNNHSYRASSFLNYRTADPDPTGLAFIARNCCDLMLRLQFCLRILCMIFAMGVLVCVAFGATARGNCLFQGTLDPAPVLHVISSKRLNYTDHSYPVNDFGEDRPPPHFSGDAFCTLPMLLAALSWITALPFIVLDAFVRFSTLKRSASFIAGVDTAISILMVGLWAICSIALVIFVVQSDSDLFELYQMSSTFASIGVLCAGLCFCGWLGVFLMALRNLRRERQARQRALSSYVEQRSAYRNLLASNAAADESDDEEPSRSVSNAVPEPDLPSGPPGDSDSDRSERAAHGVNVKPDAQSAASGAALPVAGSSDA